jgi:hypothetical protein
LLRFTSHLVLRGTHHCSGYPSHTVLRGPYNRSG